MSTNGRALYRAATFVAIENNKGEFLLQRRANTGFLDSYYDFASGHLEHGESYEACAMREVKEELGIKVTLTDLEIAALCQTAFEPGVHYVDVIFRTKIFKGTPIIGEPEKIDHMGWYAPNDFPAKLTVGVRVFLMSLKDDGVQNYYIDAARYKEMIGKSYE